MVEKLTFGQKAADFAAARIGSWGFLIALNAFMLTWGVVNIHQGKLAFDPPPFIGLNLVLSWLAGIQAPLIMISQNRQEEIQRETLIAILTISQATRELLAEQNDAIGEILDNMD